VPIKGREKEYPSARSERAVKSLDWSAENAATIHYFTPVVNRPSGGLGFRGDGRDGESGSLWVWRVGSRFKGRGQFVHDLYGFEADANDLADEGDDVFWVVVAIGV
jgi:hypothetical protein